MGVIVAGSATDPLQVVRRQTLRDAGYLEGQTIEVGWRFAEGRSERLPSLATELVSSEVAAIVTFGGAATAAARMATTKIPIVAVADDLVAEGHVASLARPGGNVTGVSLLSTELDLKRLEVLKQVVPSASRVAVFKDATAPSGHLATLQAGGHAMGLTLQILEIRKVEDLEGAFQAARGSRAQGLNVLASPLLNGLRRTIIELAAKHRLPAVYQWPESARDGGLIAYGPTVTGMYQLTFALLDKVLKGAKPSELPAVQPSEYKLALNLRTARALGLTIPPVWCLGRMRSFIESRTAAQHHAPTVQGLAFARPQAAERGVERLEARRADAAGDNMILWRRGFFITLAVVALASHSRVVE